VTYQGGTYGPSDIPELTTRMVAAAESLHFEEAARLRDVIKAIESGATPPSEAAGQAIKQPRGRRRAGVKRR
jgi:hypothetical protein